MALGATRTLSEHASQPRLHRLGFDGSTSNCVRTYSFGSSLSKSGMGLSSKTTLSMPLSTKDAGGDTRVAVASSAGGACQRYDEIREACSRFLEGPTLLDGMLSAFALFWIWCGCKKTEAWLWSFCVVSRPAFLAELLRLFFLDVSPLHVRRPRQPRTLHGLPRFSRTRANELSGSRGSRAGAVHRARRRVFDPARKGTAGFPKPHHRRACRRSVVVRVAGTSSEGGA